MLAVKILTDEEYEEFFDGSHDGADKAPMPVSQMATFRGASGGGGGAQNSGNSGGGAQQNPIGMLRQRRDM